MKEISRVVIYWKNIAEPNGGVRFMLEEYEFLRSLGIWATILTFGVKKEATFNYDIRDMLVLHERPAFIPNIVLLRKTLREIEPDLVIGVGGSASELYLATAFTSIPYVIHMHATFFWGHGDVSLKYASLHKRVFGDIMQSVRGHREFALAHTKLQAKNRIELEVAAVLDYLAVRKAALITVLSPHMQWEVAKIYSRESIVIRGGISTRLLSYIPKQDIKQKLGISDKRVILSVSVLNRNKRIALLLEAFSKLSKEFEDLELVVVGDGPERETLQALAKHLCVDGKTIFTGFVDDSDLWDYYSACDVFVSTAWADFDLALYEALALHKKVVSSSETSGGLIKAEQVLFADPTADDFATGIRKALSSEVKSSLDLSDFTWETMFAELLGKIAARIKN